jgi:hypothetical protein
MDINTKTILQYLAAHKQYQQPLIFCDLACGKTNWISEVNTSDLFNKMIYIGIDIDADIIHQNLYQGSGLKLNFRIADIFIDPLPKADIIFGLERLFHYPLNDMIDLINNIISSQSKTLICNSDPLASTNQETIMGEYRQLNLCLPPFNFPAADEIIKPGNNKTLSIWNLKNIKKILPK